MADIPELLPIDAAPTSPPSDEENRKFGIRKTPAWRNSLSGLSATDNLQKNFYEISAPVQPTHKSYTNLTTVSQNSMPTSINVLPKKVDNSKLLVSRKFSTRMSVADIPNVDLGPCQVQPKGYKLTTNRYGEIRLSLIKIKGNVEIEVINLGFKF